jgi:SET domain-containing protein
MENQCNNKNKIIKKSHSAKLLVECDNSFSAIYEYLKTKIPEQLYLKESNIGGFGLFAKTYIPQYTIFHSNLIGTGFNSKDFHNYRWVGGYLYDGIGFWCNGSCNMFKNNNCISDPKWKKLDYNITPNGFSPDRTILKFKTIKPINLNEELILNYGDSYFKNRLNKL